MLQLFPLLLPHLVELFHRRHLSIVLPLILLIRKLFHNLILSFINESLRLIEELLLTDHGGVYFGTADTSSEEEPHGGTESHAAQDDHGAAA